MLGAPLTRMVGVLPGGDHARHRTERVPGAAGHGAAAVEAFPRVHPGTAADGVGPVQDPLPAGAPPPRTTPPDTEARA